VKSISVNSKTREVIINYNSETSYSVPASVNPNSFYNRICEIARKKQIDYGSEENFKLQKYRNFISYFNGNKKCPVYRKDSLHFTKTEILTVDKKNKKIISNIPIDIF
jgi:hypothetical protein